MKILRLILVGGSILLLLLGGVAYDATDPIPVGGCEVSLPSPNPNPEPKPNPETNPKPDPVTPYPAK